VDLWAGRSNLIIGLVLDHFAHRLSEAGARDYGMVLVLLTNK